MNKIKRKTSPPTTPNRSRKVRLPPYRMPPSPLLRISPTAWAKLLYLRDRGQTEVGGFGIRGGDDLLYVEDVQLVEQVCTFAGVVFDDASVADFFDRQVDRGLRPAQFARIWVHTHPGDCPQPSGTDEETFARAFGKADWSVMFILAQGGQAYARLQLNVGPGASIEIPVEIDYSQPFSGSDPDAWEKEYLANVRIAPDDLTFGLETNQPGDLSGDRWLDDWSEYTDEDLTGQVERLTP